MNPCEFSNVENLSEARILTNPIDYDYNTFTHLLPPQTLARLQQGAPTFHDSDYGSVDSRIPYAVCPSVLTIAPR